MSDKLPVYFVVLEQGFVEEGRGLTGTPPVSAESYSLLCYHLLSSDYQILNRTGTPVLGVSMLLDGRAIRMMFQFITPGYVTIARKCRQRKLNREVSTYIGR